jgi:hypothetical protein
VGILGVFALAVSVPAHATDIWTNWTAPGSHAAGGTGGVAVGFMNGNNEVAFFGDVAGNGADNSTGANLSMAYAAGKGGSTLYPGELTAGGNAPTWETPTLANPNPTTFGGVANAPPTSFNSIPLVGGNPEVEYITFSTPVTDPLIAIWSLGVSYPSGTPGTIDASFDFLNAAGVVLLSGGPDQYGGGSIAVNGNFVTGEEGSGVVEILGTFGNDTNGLTGNGIAGIELTTPTAEDYYAFSVGEMGETPEPETLSLFGLGLLALPLLRSRLARRRA